MKKQKKVKPGRLKRRENMMGYVFILPWVLGLLGLVIYPLFESFHYSLNRVIMNPLLGRVMTPVGFDNYRNIFLVDTDFVFQLESYLLQTAISVPVIVAFALIIAMMLNGKIRCKGFFRLIFFLPVIIASGPVMNQLTSQGAASIPMMNVSMITGVFEEHLPRVLATALSSVFSNIIMLLWYSGVQILIFLAALQKIDSSLYEAAKIDGGSGWECFWKITIPTIKPMILLNMVYTIIFMSNTETNGIITLISTRMFSSAGGGAGGYGYAAAMAWCYSVVVTLLVVSMAALVMVRKVISARRAEKFRKVQMKQEC
ncbi:MAG: sugar ABC transporter permease, partial [Lachnospiraceae bacterium]|nr:sugar ABC transporter permease [Lachnospiraceae bacterium]